MRLRRAFPAASRGAEPGTPAREPAPVLRPAPPGDAAGPATPAAAGPFAIRAAGPGEPPGDAGAPGGAAAGTPGDGSGDRTGDGAGEGAPPAGGEGPFEGAVVRRLTAADVIAFRAVWLEALRLHPEVHASTLADWVKRPLAAYVERMEQGAVFGLFTARGLEGLIACRQGQGGNERHRAEIEAAYVRAHLRRRGAARAMLAEALKQAQADGVVQVAVAVTSADPAGLAFWENAGFVHFATLPRGYRVEGRYLDAYHLILEIG